MAGLDVYTRARLEDAPKRGEHAKVGGRPNSAREPEKARKTTTSASAQKPERKVVLFYF